jgi:hypothetical protein
MIVGSRGFKHRRTLIWRLRWPIDGNVEVTQVVIVRHCADSRHTVLVVGQQGVACDGKECSTYASSARRWVSLMMRLERAIVAARRLSRDECLRRVGSLTRVGLKWRMSCGSGRTLDVGDMQPIR